MPSKKRPHAAAHRPSSTSPRSKRASSAATQTLAPPRPAAAPAALPHPGAEWLEADGLGGFASGTVSGIRTRRTHALLLAARPQGGPVVLVNGFDARVTTPRGAFDLTSHRYAPDVVHPDGHRRIESFTTDPWPTWVYRLEDGIRIEQQIFTVSGAAGVILTWSVVDGPAAGAQLMVRPLLSGREARALHHENPHFRAEAVCCDQSVEWRPYESLPAVLAGSNGHYAHHPFWYRNFLYEADRAAGRDHVEDLHSPGAFRFDLARGEAVLVLTTAEGLRAMESHAAARAAGLPGFVGPTSGDPEGALEALRESERAARADHAPILRAADAYVIRSGDATAVAAGYPRARASSRETFASVRGLCIATGRLDDAKRILLPWVATLSRGLFPTTFPEGAAQPRYDAVDAPLWFIVAARELLRAPADGRRRLTAAERNTLRGAIEAILPWYVEGTRHRIRMDEDGLLAAGEPDARVTWMDKACGAIAPRVGKAVEVQALWLNALRAASEISARWDGLYERGRASFERRFWKEGDSYLHDVVDFNHERGASESSFRPNQILAVGGLPFPVLEGKRARQVVDLVEARLFTPMGLRAGPPEDAAAPRVAWPWLLGPFVAAWVRVRGDTAEARAEARDRFLMPLLAGLAEGTGPGGLGHLPEAADADPPHAGRGAPFYALSIAEAVRLDRAVLPAP